MEDTSVTYKTMVGDWTIETPTVESIIDEIRNTEPTAVPLIVPEIGASPNRLVTMQDFDQADSLTNALPHMIEIYIQDRITTIMEPYVKVRQYLDIPMLSDTLMEEIGNRVRHVLHDVLNREGIRMYHHDVPTQEDGILKVVVMFQHRDGLRPVTRECEFELEFEEIKDSFPDEMIVLSKEVNNIILFHVFKEHDEAMRVELISELRHRLLNYKDRNIIAGYDVIVDDSNNPPEVVDGNRIRINVVYFGNIIGDDGTELRVTVQLNDQFQNAFDRAMKGV